MTANSPFFEFLELPISYFLTIPKYEIVQKFMRPWDLVRQLNLGEFDGLTYLSPEGLRACQFEALTNLEKSSGQSHDFFEG